MIVWAHTVLLTWKNMTSCLRTLEKRRGRGSFMFTRITASCQPWRQALASHAKQNLQCLGYYTHNYTDFVSSKCHKRILFLDPIPLNGCVRQNSLEEAAIVSLLTQSAEEWRKGEMDILPEDPRDHSKKKKKNPGVITHKHSIWTLFFLQMRKWSKLFQLHFKRYSFF